MSISIVSSVSTFDKRGSFTIRQDINSVYPAAELVPLNRIGNITACPADNRDVKLNSIFNAWTTTTQLRALRR